MSVERCKHGMIKGQCGVCKLWHERSWTKKEESGLDKNESPKAKEAKA